MAMAPAGRGSDFGGDGSFGRGSKRSRDNGDDFPNEPPKSSKIKKQKQCPICAEPVNHVSRHVTANHLPWWIRLDWCCWECEDQCNSYKMVNKMHSGHIGNIQGTEVPAPTRKRWVQLAAGFLSELAIRLEVQTVSGLLQFVCEHQLYPMDNPNAVNREDWQIQCLQDLSMRLRSVFPLTGVTFRPPNCEAALSSPEIIAQILVGSTVALQSWVRAYPSEVYVDPPAPLIRQNQAPSSLSVTDVLAAVAEAQSASWSRSVGVQETPVTSSSMSSGTANTSATSSVRPCTSRPELTAARHLPMEPSPIAHRSCQRPTAAATFVRPLLEDAPGVHFRGAGSGPQPILSRRAWTRSKQVVLPDPKIPPSESSGPVDVYDSHIHMDEMINRKPESLRAFSEVYYYGTVPLRLTGAIANFVYPNKWDMQNHILSQYPTVRATYGIHPNLIESRPSSEIFSRLAALLNSAKCVGLGAIGLDSTDHNKSTQVLQCQALFLRELLGLLNPAKHTLVLHCRDNGTGFAALDTLQILRESNLTHCRIHRQSFIGDPSEAKMWCEALPNCCFGITSASLSSDSTRDAIQSLSLEKLILETGGPYLGHPPLDLYNTARIVGQIKRVSPRTVIASSNASISNLYRL